MSIKTLFFLEGFPLPFLFLPLPPSSLLSPKGNFLLPCVHSGSLVPDPYHPTGMRGTTHYPVLLYTQGEDALTPLC